MCVATSGLGAIHLLNGLYDAKLDGQPVLAITGMQFHDLIATWTQQDVETDKLFMDVAQYNARVMGAAHMRNVAKLRLQDGAGLPLRRPYHHPGGFQEQALGDDERSKRNVGGHNIGYFAKAAVARPPGEQELRAAAEVLNAGRKIVILAGRGALNATDELEMLADKLGAVICKALLGKAAVPDDSPFTSGQVGLLGTRPSQDALENCDTLLIAGSSFPYIEYYPKPDQARAVQIEQDPMRIGLRYPVEVGLVGDCKATLQALLPYVGRNENRTFLEEMQKDKREWDKLMEERGTRQDMPMKPQVVAWELGKRLRDDAIVSCDSGTIATWWARQIPVKRGQMHSLSGNLATMAPGLPYSIAAQIAYPDRQVVAFVGDGGFSMLMADFVTCVKYKLPVKIFVINNLSLGQIKWEQMVFLGHPEYDCDLAPIDFAMVARACGGAGRTVREPGDCGRIIEDALNTPGPVVVDCYVDTHEPPMPPKIKPGQAVKFAEALARGTPAGGKIALTVASDKVRELI